MQQVLLDYTAGILRVVQKCLWLPLFSQHLVIVCIDEKSNSSTKIIVVITVVIFALNFYVNFLAPKSSPSRMMSAPSQPLRMIPGNKPNGVTRDPGPGAPRSSGKTTQPVSVEAFSGLRLRSVTVTAPHLPTCPARQIDMGPSFPTAEPFRNGVFV